MIRNVLFDLDGTLVDSSATIAASIVHALERLGVDGDGHAPVSSWIGQPLFDVFTGGFGMSEAQAQTAIDHYREHYDALNQAGTRVYDQVPEVLAGLREHGLSLYVATVKPTAIAEKVLGDLDLRPFFSGVAGGSMGPERRHKTRIIAHALDRFGLDSAQSIMIGDRDQDIEGARANGLRSLGVTYGFGSREEIAACRPDFTAESSRDVMDLVLAGCEG